MRYFFQGLTMGLAYVAPIGLQNLFVINSALTHTRRRALMTTLIVIFFDVTLALACFFGMAADGDSAGGKSDCSLHRRRSSESKAGRDRQVRIGHLHTKNDIFRLCGDLV